MSGARRLEASLVASALLHALALAVVLRGARVTLRPPLVAIPVALVSRAGGGGGAARAPYATNPPPPYPLVARRLGKEGVVLLEVLVAPDGRAMDVRMIHSSGFAPLDESAVTTVRERWRFVPARRDGVPVESRVTVPIRFRLAGEPG